MKKNNSFLTRLVIALLPLTATAQSVTLADWNLESSEDIAATWFGQGGAPQIAPDECVGDKADYLLTGWSEGRYWQVCTGEVYGDVLVALGGELHLVVDVVL